MDDEHTTIAELRRLVNDFVDRRDWHGEIGKQNSGPKGGSSQATMASGDDQPLKRLS